MTTELLPFSQDAEEAVIGSILISAQVFPSLVGILRGDDFFLTRHRHIWNAFEALAERGDAIDLTSVSTELLESGKLDDMGMEGDEIRGFAYLLHLVNAPTNSMHVGTYARLVQRLSVRRQLRKVADDLARASTNEDISTDLAIGRADRAILDLRRRQMAVDSPVISFAEAIERKRKKLQEAWDLFQENPRYVIGVRTGLTDLDALIDGLRPGVTTLAAATGMGKTALTLQMSLFAARAGRLRLNEYPSNVLFFSGEMTEDQLMNRLLSSRTGIPVRNIERGNLSQENAGHIHNVFQDLEDNHHLSFESGKRLNTAQIRQRVRTMVNENALDLLVLDGLLQIDDLKIDATATSQQRRYMEGKRRDAIESIMNDLEDVSLTYETPILLTHQLSRAPAARGDKRPILSDLAEASFVEQKSAVILFLFRDGYYNADSMNPNAAEVIVAKNRHGETGTIDAYYDRQYTRFLNADRQKIALGGDA
jgi:replicative DNA helicase